MIETNRRLEHTVHQADVCVVGGGMAGLCAALAAARRGARTVILQDRPMFGGNASSEVRMWICGAHGRHNKEAGLLEELQLENLHLNPGLGYAQWDHVMHAKAMHQPRLTPLLNCTCLDAEIASSANDADHRIESITGWQLTSQTFHTVKASIFIDCSGDSILAPLSGAATRWGRESSADFGEDIQPEQADRRTMGNSILIQLRRTSEPQPFLPPKWAYKFLSADDLPCRINGVNASNFWWLELGGLNDTIRDAESIRDELLKVAYGVWDYIKNHAPEKTKAANWELFWIGSVPGKRENRRYQGDYTLTQHDIEAGGSFDDTVAYGGWSMDDHHPAGLLYPGEPTIFHAAPSPYGIPYRCLYSLNVENLMFAGRNISVTHAALSSTRVMGTCAILGQAAGTAAALATSHGIAPRDVHRHHIDELQQVLMDDDCFLPGFARSASAITGTASLEGDGRGLDRLVDGCDRDREDESHAWEGRCGDRITFRWSRPTRVGMLRCTFDSNLNNDKRMPASYPVKTDRCAMPKQLVKAFRVEIMGASGEWRVVHRESENTRRLVRVPIEQEASAVSLIPEATWGGDGDVRIFAVEPDKSFADLIPDMPDGERFTAVRSRQAETDLAPPAKVQGEAVAHTASA